SLVAPEAGALPSQFSHGAIRANFDQAGIVKGIAGNHRNAERGMRSAESRGAQPPRLRFGAPSRRTFGRGTSESVCTRATRSQRRGRRWLRPRRARSPANSVTVRFVRISIWRIFLRISRGIIGMRNAECGITGSATASAAVRRALAPNIWPGDKRIGLHARDAKPTTRASLAAPEAGPL